MPNKRVSSSPNITLRLHPRIARYAGIGSLYANPAAGPPAPGAHPLRPIIDGWVLPDSPNNMSAKGPDNDVAVITGFQSGDSAFFNPTYFQSLDELPCR